METLPQKYSGKLEVLLSPLTRGQRIYLTLRLCDYPKVDALMVANRAAASVDRWEREESFKQLEEHILLHKDRYREQALVAYAKNISIRARVFLERVIEDGLTKLDDKDKDMAFLRLAMQAAGMVHRLSPPSQPSGEAFDYDEMILKRRRVKKDDEDKG